MSWSWLFRQGWNYAVLVGLGILSYCLVSHLVFQSVTVSGSSMYPTLADSGHYWLNRYAYLLGQPCQDDIVALKDPRDNSLEVKRIIATPGQSVYLKNGKVYVDGQMLRETYLLPGMPTYAYEKSENEFVCCGKDQFFVLGDNRSISMDSRAFGAVPRQNILGKVVE
jgi:signal peptidase I